MRMTVPINSMEATVVTNFIKKYWMSLTYHFGLVWVVGSNVSVA